MISIYKITNLITNKSYIGVTSTSMYLRLKEHLHSRVSRNGSSVIGDDIFRLGYDCFTIDVLETTECINKGYDLEKYYISKYNTFYPSGYNKTLGGKATTGYKHTAETKIKMRKNNNSKSGSENHFYGKKHTSEVKAIMSKCAKERLEDVAYKDKLIARLRDGTVTKSVINIDTGKIYKTVTECADDLKVAGTNVSRACKSKTRKVRGFTIKYYPLEQDNTVPSL